MSYIKLDRKTLEWGWFKDTNTTHLWIYILLSANFKENIWRGETFEIGSFPSSIEKISADTGLSIQSVRTGLKRLEKTGEITRISTNHGTKIIVNKWAEYQCSDDEPNIQPNKQLTSNQQATNKQLTTLKESKKVIREEYTSKEEINKEEMDCSPEFAEALEAFAEMRKKIRKPLTEKAKQMVLKKLSSLAEDEGTQIEILNQSTMNSWQGVFPLPTQTGKEKKGLEALMQI